MAIGRTPPRFLLSEMSVLPERTGFKKSRTLPERQLLQGVVKLLTRLLPASFDSLDLTCFRCCGRSPEGPAVLQVAKEQMAARNSSSSSEG